MLTDITAIFVTYRSAGVIAEALACVPEEMPVIVVDNASGDGTLDLVRARRPNAQIIANAENIGYGRALNQGARAATTPFVFLLNPDLMLSRPAVEALRAAADAYPDAILFGPAVDGRDGTLEYAPRPDLFSRGHTLFKSLVGSGNFTSAAPETTCPVGWIGGAAILARREAFLALGGFDERIFLFFEETDLCHRAVLAGHAPIWVPHARVRHLQGASSGAPTPRSVYFREWHFAWSRFYLARKYAANVPPWPRLVFPLQYAVKGFWYGIFGPPRKATYYRAQLAGARAALAGRPADAAAPWHGDQRWLDELSA